MTTFHILYKTTNKVNGKYYIGMHSTKNLLDGYVGSGKIIRRSLVKYGKENHTFEILEYARSREHLSALENLAISKEMILCVNCMNLKAGGENTGFSGGKHTEESKAKISKANTNRFRSEKSKELISSKLTGIKRSQETKQKMSLAKQKMSMETKQKMSNSKKGKTTANSKQVTINNVTYKSISEAARILGKSRDTIKNTIKSSALLFLR